MRRWFLGLAFLTTVASPVLCLKQLRLLSYLKLPSFDNGTQTNQLFGGSAEEGAFDSREHYLYVVGEESRVLHVVDLSDPASPTVVFREFFSPADGIPRDVDVCGQEVAVALTSPIPVMPGTVRFYHTIKRGDPRLTRDGEVKVGSFPDNLRYTPDCSRLLVANEGRAGIGQTGTLVDPEGSISIIKAGDPGNRVVNTLDFKKFNDRQDIRHVARRTVDSGLNETTLSQDLEPEFIDFSPDGATAYVSIQENNAIAVVSIYNAEITSLVSLGTKDWSESALDPSDQDGGVHLSSYPLRGLYQPDVIKVFQLGQKTYLASANEGAITSYRYTSHAHTWTDAVAATNLADVVGVNIFNQTFLEQLNSDSELGRLLVSKLDGLGLHGVEHVHTFGGRGFSIWEASDMALPVFDSGKDIEQYNDWFLHHVFNSDCDDTFTKSPENLRDVTSRQMGPKLNALDVREDDGVLYLIVGSETMGSIYLYTLDKDSPLPPHLQDVRREGETDLVWQELYDRGVSGDAYISKIGILLKMENSLNKTLVYVLSNGSGSLSIYEIYDDPVLTAPFI